MEILLNIVGTYALKWKIEFSGPKSLIIPLRRDTNDNIRWKLGCMYITENEKRTITINEEREAKYLGITISKHKNDLLTKHRMDLVEKTKKETGRCYRPATATARPTVYGTKIWKTYVIPKILHGIAAIPFSTNTFTKVETQQREFIRMISKLPRHTHRAVLYGETDILPIIMEAEKRTINYLIHLLKIDNNHIVKLVIQEQLQQYYSNPTKKSWLLHAINCCKRYDINFLLLQSPNIIKHTIRNKWILEYQEMIDTASTLKYYKQKLIPKLNNKLNLHTGGDFWLKAKSGSLLLNIRSNTICNRCKEGKIESLEHLLWLCKHNTEIVNIKQQILQLWGSLPLSIDGEVKPEYIPTQNCIYLELGTKWLLNDNLHGSLINLCGTILKKLYNLRPETILFATQIHVVGHTKYRDGNRTVLKHNSSNTIISLEQDPRNLQEMTMNNEEIWDNQKTME